MSSQFGIYATAADMRKIGGLIESIGEPFLIFEDTKIGSSPTMLHDLASSESLVFRICRRSDFDDVLWSRLRDGSEYVDNFASPVIEVFRSYFDGKEMSRGRLCYQSSYFDDRGRKVEKPDAFVKWARAAFRKVKSELSLHKELPLPTYVGATAEAWLREQGTYEVSNNGRIAVKSR